MLEKEAQCNIMRYSNHIDKKIQELLCEKKKTTTCCPKKTSRKISKYWAYIQYKKEI